MESSTGAAQPAEGVRERYRRQVRGEVRERAWEQITSAGVAGLSLKAIATQLGMTAPALYRYYDSRDELLTELILSTYGDLAELVEAAASSVSGPAESLAAVARALRVWALEHPQRYLLVYGTPVPGYHAPAAATELARRIFAPILAGFSGLTGGDPDTAAGAAEHRSLTMWTRLHGVLSLQLAGHFTGMGFDTDQLYEDEIRCLLDSLAPEPGARSPEPGARSPEPGARSPEPGARSPEPGARSSDA